MKQHPHDISPPVESDPLVSAEYRAIAREQTPRALDAAVLEKARVAARNPSLRRFMAIGFRPLAFAATIVLSLALVLELTRAPDQRSVPDSQFEAVDRHRQSPAKTATPHNDGATRDDPDLRGESTHALRSGKPHAATGDVDGTQAPMEANTPLDEKQASDGFAEVIDESLTQMREKNGDVGNSAQGIQRAPVAGKPPVGEAAAIRAPDVASNSAARFCTEEQIADPAQWWNCILDLNNAGRHHDAGIERDLFEEANPNFVPTETP